MESSAAPPPSSPPPGPSLRGRAVLALALTAGFYSLALAIGIGLVAAPVALFASTGRGNIWIAIGMIVAGVTVLRAIVPERSRFEAPGPPVGPTEQPELHGLLSEVAGSVGEPMPAEVYFDPDLNAAVTEIPNGVGRGRRRVMLVGLPLLAVVRPAELRAVIAHEFGHYVGGDTRFGAWIWRTRVAVLRTVAALDNEESFFQRVVVRGPFVLYAKLFLRLTNAVSRRQEFAADALSAQIAGMDSASGALRQITACSPAFDAYWQQEVAFALANDRRPPIAEGLQRFVRAREVNARLDELVRGEIAEAETDPYDSHPTLGERLAALGGEQTGEIRPPAPDESALALVHSVGDVERDLLLASFGNEAVDHLRPIAWEDAGSLHAEDADQLAVRLTPVFGEVNVERAGALAADPASTREALKRCVEAGGATDEEIDGYQRFALASLIAGALARDGWNLQALPGEPISARKGGSELVPSQELEAIGKSGMTADGWARRAAELGIGHLPLVPRGDPVAAPAG